MNATLPSSRAGASCVENSRTHKIYCFGGHLDTAPHGYTSEITEYTPSTDTLVTKSARFPSSLTVRSCAENSATHKIYCFGGAAPDASVAPESTIFEYDTETDTLTPKSAVLPFWRYALTCTEDSSTHIIYCMGGVNGWGSATDQIAAYNPANDTIIVKNARLPSGSYIRGCTEDRQTHHIFCFGGNTPYVMLNEILDYNPAADVMTTTSGLMPKAFSGLACVQNTGSRKIYCLGGFSTADNRYGSPGTYLDTVYEYSIPDQAFTLVPSAVLPAGRNLWYQGCAEDSSTHLIYCFGGDNGTSVTNQILRLGSGALPECSDGLDNDGDGEIDFPLDPGCTDPSDNSEENPVLSPQCTDGIDNDGDGLTDFPDDPGCSGIDDDDETGGPFSSSSSVASSASTVSSTDSQSSAASSVSSALLGTVCSDGLDNDGDGAVDWPNDFSCDSPQDQDESAPVTECQDGIDNDGDGRIDLADGQCRNRQDTAESALGTCSDGIDNDADGFIDFGRDPGCLTVHDPDEFNTFQCTDGVDNDQDGATDFPVDFSCSSGIDADEFLPVAACQDGVDNDGDGLIDYHDLGCGTAYDNDERN